MSDLDIQLGIGISRLDRVAQCAQNAEQLGYDFIGTGEHVFFYGPISNGLISLAAAAGATQRIQLMSTITLLPLYPPALLAKQVATLNFVSDGRFHLGVGVGGEFAKEFEACGVPVKERGRRTNEILHILEQLFTGESVDFQGDFYTMPGVTLDPAPRQIVPTWISGRSEAAMDRCARYGTGWLPYMYTPEQLDRSLDFIQTRAEEYNRNPVRPGQFIFFAVHEDRDTAIQMASDRLSKQYNQDFSKLVHKYAVAGNPDDCVARLNEYVEAGARTFMLNSACPSSYTADNEKLMAEQVLPKFKN